MPLNTKILTALLFFIPCSSWCQQNDYPQGYFRNPLNIPILLAGNYGECRPGHFHAGLDIKTSGVENLPVYAAADGYVSRIKMEKGGYGHALYITHPNGYTTLYGHLNKFSPELQQYLRDQQYKQQSWIVDLVPPPTLFPVTRGQQIAWSGNTGASTAPHVHFEIRDTKTEHPLNGSLFGFDIADNRAPSLYRIAVYDLDRSVYQQKPSIYSLHQEGNIYKTAKDTLLLSSLHAGIGIHTDDYMNGSTNTLALYTAKLIVDSLQECAIRLDNIGFDKSRYLHAYADYKTKQENGYWLQCLFKLPGNHLDQIYEILNGRHGAIDLSDGKPHFARIIIADAFGNTSEVNFFIRSDLKAAKDNCIDFLSVNTSNQFQDINISYTLGEDALYDNVCLNLERKENPTAYSGTYILNDVDVPLHRFFDLKIKPEKLIPFEERNKVVMMHMEGKTISGSAAKYTDNGWYSAGTRNFGAYWLQTDIQAPEFASLNGNTSVIKTKQLRFRIADALTSVKNYTAELDGKWLLLEPAGSIYTYEFDEHCPDGKHTLVITASDENDNTDTFTYTFTK